MLFTDNSWCIVTKMVVESDFHIKYVYREEEIVNSTDSGLRLMSGNESQNYLDDPGNSVVYLVTSILKRVPQLKSCIHLLPGEAMELNKNGNFKKIVE